MLGLRMMLGSTSVALANNIKLITEPAFLPNTCYVRLWVFKTKRKMKTDLKEIAEKVQKMIDYEVSKIENNETKWKNQYENVMNELEGELKYTNEIIEEFKESKLSVNVIEQEGYRRCLETMINKFRDFEKYE